MLTTLIILNVFISDSNALKVLRDIVTACAEKNLQINKLEKQSHARKQGKKGQSTTMIEGVETA